MANVTITAYQFKIRMARNDDGFPLDDFNGGLDSLNSLLRIIESWGTTDDIPGEVVSDDKTSKALLVNDAHIEGRSIAGTVRAGEYGVERTIFDTLTGVRTGRISKEGASTLPFQFILHVPNGRDTGVLLCQRYNNSGMYGIFSEQLSADFRSRNEGYILDFEQLVSRELADQWLNNGLVKNIVFRSADSTRIANEIIRGESGLDANDFHVELRLVAKRRRSAISNMFMSERREQNTLSSQSFRELLAVRGFQESEVKLQVRMSGRQRTFRAEDLSRMGAFLDISEDINFDEATGLPEIEDVKREIREYLGEIQGILYNGTNDG